MFLKKKLFSRRDVVEKEHQNHLDGGREFEGGSSRTMQIVHWLLDRLGKDVHHKEMPAGRASAAHEAFVFIPGMLEEGRLASGVDSDTTLYELKS